MVHRLPRFVTFMPPVQSVAFIVQAVLLQVIYFKAWSSGHQLVLHRFVSHGLFLMNMFVALWFSIFSSIGLPCFSPGVPTSIARRFHQKCKSNPIAVSIISSIVLAQSS